MKTRHRKIIKNLEHFSAIKLPILLQKFAKKINKIVIDELTKYQSF